MAVSLKRPLEDAVFHTKHILMDIEGTTTSISFVKETLFPYVRKNLDAYVDSNWNEEEFQSVLALLRDQAREDKAASLEGTVEIPSEGAVKDVQSAVVKNVLWQMDSDRKTTGLKKLQGHMWKQGYKNGELKGHLFADVAPALREWVKDGRKLYIYSSGSVEAQKLLFGNSSEGDLLELFSDFFDTEMGAKVEAASYRAIVEKLQCKADDILFLTDLPKEASAARQAGLPVILVQRDGNEPIASEFLKEFSSVSSFGDLAFEVSIKKHKVADEAEAIEASSKTVTGETVLDEAKESGASSELLDVEAQAMDVVEATNPAVDASSKPSDVEAVKPAGANDDATVKTKPTEESVTTEIEPKAVQLSMDEAVPSSVESKDSAMSAEISMPDKAKIEEEILTDVNISTVTKETPEEEALKVVEEKEKTISPESETCVNKNKTDPSASEVIASAEEVKDVDAVNDSSDARSDKEIKEPLVEAKEENVKKTIDETNSVVASTEHVDNKTEEIKNSEETDDHKSEKKTEASSEASDAKETEAEATNGTENEKDKEENKSRSANGTCNGSTNGSSAEAACVMKELEEGNMNNGHSNGNEGVPDVIVAKAVPQVEDAVLPVEA